ncbi:MAG: zeta toxin family protein [Oscillospiraceae bacterium]|nr:zeta toxin family protein [Oscillospiraceae bacterium]
MKYYDSIFSDPKFEAEYQKIKKYYTTGKTPVEKPVAVVLGGLPGSGKGNIYDFYDAKESINNNIVHIDCDQFRRYHPDAASFSPEEYGDKTNEFVFAVVDRLIDELTPEKYNFIAESAMRTPYTAFYNTNNLKPLGYRVELAVMATNIETAWQGTISRFETAKAKYEEDIANGVPNPEPPRPVPKEFFDAVKDNIENSFNLIYISENEKGEHQTPVDDIFVYTRSGEVLYHMTDTPDLNPVPILSARLHNSEQEAKVKIDEYVSDYKKSVSATSEQAPVQFRYKEISMQEFVACHTELKQLCSCKKSEDGIIMKYDAANEQKINNILSNVSVKNMKK